MFFNKTLLGLTLQGCRTVTALPWPARFPDLSPIEHIWDHFGRGDVLFYLSTWGATNPENNAAFVKQHIPKNLSALPWETPIRVYGSSMANYLISEGILSERNANLLAKAYAKSYEYFANTDNKIADTKLGFLNFAASLTALTAEKGVKMAQKFVLKIPRVKRRNHSAQKNSKRWCNDSVNTCVTEENILDPNIRIKQLLSTEKTGHSEVGNVIIVNFEQISEMLMKLKCPDCDKQTLKIALGNKVGFSYELNLFCSSCAEKVCAVEKSNERQVYGIAAETLQSEVHSEVRKAYEAPTDVPIVDISI
ncbi:hypothetical protein TNCV_2830971 [Trichonephila clavipes]|nr:hypothetical protein TNCV_2830971 [Trichonephila clavipes]